MKRRFTILTAALALLTFLAVPMGMWGQTRTTQTASYGFETVDAVWTTTNFVTNNTAITAHSGSKYGATNGTTTADVTYNTIVESPQSLTCYYSKTTTNDNANSKFHIQVSSNNTTWTTVASGLGMDQVTKGTWYELTADLSSYSNVYVRVRYDGTTGVRALDDITLTYEQGSASSATATLTQSNLELTGSYSSNASKTINGITYVHTDLMKNSNNIQAKASTGTIQNTTAYPGDITSVEITHYGTARATTINGSADGTNWTQVATGSGSITADFSGKGYKYFRITRGSNAAYWEKIDITYSTETSTDPSITADDVEIAYDVTSGEIGFTVNNPVSTASVFASVPQGSWITLGTVAESSVPFTCLANTALSERSETVTFVYVDGEQTLDTKTVTVTQAAAPAPTISANNVDLAYDVEEGYITYTINNPVAGGSVTASTEAEWLMVDDEAQTDAEGSIYFYCGANSNFYAHSATVTLTYTYGDSKATVTKDVTVTQALDPNANGSTIDNPIMVSEAIEAIDEVSTVSNIYVGGVVSSIETEYSSQYHNITFDMIDEEGNEYFLRAYRCGGNEAANVSVGDEVIVFGNLIKYGEIYEFAQGCEVVSLLHFSITVSPASVELNADEHDGTLALTYENLTITDMSDFAIQYYNAEGEETTQPDWFEVLVAEQDPTIGEGYVVSYFMLENEGEARTVYFKVYATGNVNYVYSNLVTITQEAFVPLFIGADPSTIEVGCQGTNNGNFEVLFDERLQSPYGSSVELYFYDENDNQINDPEWFQYQYIQDYHSFEYTISKNTSTEPRTARMKIKYTDPYTTATIFSDYILISQEAYVAPGSWVLTSLADLTEDDVFVIVGNNGSNYAMSNNNGTTSAPAAVAVTVVDDAITSEVAATIQWTISGNATDGYIFYPNGTTESWLYCTNANNGVRVGTENGKLFTIEDGYLKNVATSRYVGIYNSQDWRCYTSHVSSGNQQNNIEGQTFAFYKKVELPTITVNGYGDTDGGYVLLAWPESTSPTAIYGMISDNLGAQATSATATYDLYSYDESEDKEWLNYRKNSFGLVPGKGYLYASKDGVTLTYEGEANPEFADVDNLPYTENNLVKSLYLAGNSKTNEQTFYVYNSELAKQTFNYLTMNEDGDGFISGQGASYTAPAMTGFFVQAPGANMTLSTTDVNAKANASLLNINVLRSRGSVIDNAIVSFSNGSMMDKFYLKNNTTRVYIPQGNREMAIANSVAEAEMPVSFRASENGTYTLAVEAENVEMNYLHLIDNMTGMDVDLLQTPSYTFEANTNDYANRFKLVFVANGADEADESSFAFFSNGNLIVNNEGNATLQVIDINGRILSSETISGSCSKAINATTGVYMLRLINGDNVKVQKVVVR